MRYVKKYSSKWEIIEYSVVQSCRFHLISEMSFYYLWGNHDDSIYFAHKTLISMSAELLFTQYLLMADNRKRLIAIVEK